MTAAEVVPFAVAAVIVMFFVRVALEDAATSRVSVSTARTTTAIAIAGLGGWGLVTADWAALAQAAIATFAITAIQLVPFLLQPSTTPMAAERSAVTDRDSGRVTDRDSGRVPVTPDRRAEGAWIGRADVRLGVPFAWTLGWFGLGFAVVGFALALLLGLMVGAVTRRTRIPFVPFLTVGLITGLLWALARALTGEG